MKKLIIAIVAILLLTSCGNVKHRTLKTFKKWDSSQTGNFYGFVDAKYNIGDTIFNFSAERHAIVVE